VQNKIYEVTKILKLQISAYLEFDVGLPDSEIVLSKILELRVLDCCHAGNVETGLVHQLGGVVVVRDVHTDFLN